MTTKSDTHFSYLTQEVEKRIPLPSLLPAPSRQSGFFKVHVIKGD